MAVTFPDCIDDLVAASGDEAWEVLKTNQLRTCSIYRMNNKVVKRIGHIFVQTHCKSTNDIKVLPAGAERDEKLKEIFVPLWMKNKNKTKEEALADFENLDQQQRDFQEKNILNNLEWQQHEQRGEIAREFLEKLGFGIDEV